MEVQVPNCRFCGALVCEELLRVHELQYGEKCKRSPPSPLLVPEQGAPKAESPWRRW